MNTHQLNKIAISLLLGSALSVTQTPVMALSISQAPLTLGATGILPNVMLMIDNSRSMEGNVTAVGATLTPTSMPATFTYDCSSSNIVSGGSATNSPAPASLAMKINTVITNSTGTTATGPGAPVFCDNSTCSTTTRFSQTSKCFDNTKYYHVKYFGSGSNLTTTPVLGKNLNWYFSTGTFVGGTLTRSSTAWSRMMIAKAAAINLVNAQTPKSGENATIRIGLTTFEAAANGSPLPQGGRLLIPMTDLKAPCTASITTNCNATAQTIKNSIGTTGDNSGSIVPTHATPLAETLADIGRYFVQGYTGNLTIHPAATDSSKKTLTINEVLGTSRTATANTAATVNPIANNNGLTNVTTSTPNPIQYYCQKSAVILVTDGLPNTDREISPHLRDYTGDCATKGLCDATAWIDSNSKPFSNDGLGNSASHPMGIAANGQTIPATTNCKLSGTATGSTTTPANTKDYLNNLACQNGTKTGRTYETEGSDYLDDVAQALFDMDLRPAASWDGGKPITVKNNLKTYAIGIADPKLQADGILKDAAIKGGGTFAYAADFGALADALDKIIESVRKGVGSFSAIVANGTQLGVGSALFQAKYDTASWTGDFLALPLSVNEDTNKNGQLDTTSPTEDVNGNGVWDKGGQVLPEAWNAGKIPPLRNVNNTTWSSRAIYTYSAAAKGILLSPSTCSSLSASQRTGLGITSCTGTADTGLWRLDYMRGDTSHEVADEAHQASYTDPRSTSNNTPTNRIFRNRIRFNEDDSLLQDPWLLGDIINSDAAYVGTENYRYDTLAGMSSAEKAAYKTFVGAAATPATGSTAATSDTGKYLRRKMVYIGANDGMLHGFDARIPAQVSPATNPVTYVANAEAGKEILAYLPNGVFSGLQSLSSPDYVHRYFVDGSPKVSDVYYGGAWHTVLVGTTGAGGKSIFALDVTDPSTFSASKVLWELNDDANNIPANLNGAAITTFQTNFVNNIGYTLPQPYIGKMKNGKWAAIVSNGYLSANNRAVLFIIDIETGGIIKTIDTGAGTATNPNGLSTPLAIDYDATGAVDGVIDAIYAGDLLGNMWKFDVSDTNENNWKVAYTSGSNPAPLFIACSDKANCDTTRQPITNPPQAGKVGTDQTPTSSVMVYFGTGKYFENSDNDIANTQTQSFYGIWDECPLGGSATKCSTTVAKNNLQPQTILAEVTNVRVTSDNAIDYTTKKGWYMDFIDLTTGKSNGERIVSASLLRSGRIIFVTLIPIPVTSANDTPSCTAGSKSTSWLMELDAVSGKRPDTPVFDTSNNGTVDSGDMITVTIGGKAVSVPASGVKAGKGSSDTPAMLDTDSTSTNSPCEKGFHEVKTYLGSSEGSGPELKSRCEPNTTDTNAGRQSWRQL